MKLYGLVVLVVVLAAMLLGGVLPALVSASSDLALLVAFGLVLVAVPVFVVVFKLLTKEVKKYVD